VNQAGGCGHDTLVGVEQGHDVPPWHHERVARRQLCSWQRQERGHRRLARDPSSVAAVHQLAEGTRHGYECDRMKLSAVQARWSPERRLTRCA
jgi:hypothetical protein